MILDLRGEKTFMLCTHLLSEAESLCDMISIMIKGSIYTIGSPAYLSKKFGTEYKVDVMLEDDVPETGMKCDRFFQRAIPAAELAITRPKARIYNVPARGLTLPQLFVAMEDGRTGDCGFSYYTCSSSSLERVFMEIVRMSQCDDVMC
jgi:ABC-type multidrug transport system ATPase subunit